MRRKPHKVIATFQKPAGYVDAVTMPAAEAVRRWPQHEAAIQAAQRTGATQALPDGRGGTLYIARSGEREEG